MSRRNLTILIAGLMVGLVCFLRAESNPYARYASGAYRMIDDLALESPPDDELFAGAVRGMVSVLRQRGDVHSGYLEPVSTASFTAEMRQQFGGVGVRVGLEGDPPRVTVVEPPQPGTPAYDSPIRSGDRILAVDGVDTSAMDLVNVVDRMRGEPGVPLELTVRHDDGREESFRLVREIIRVPSVIGDRRTPDGGWRYRLEEAPDLALVRLTTFGDRTGRELSEALDRLTSDGVRGVVLDLRNNPGGAVDAAIAVCELLLPAGTPIVSTRGRDGEVLSSYETTTDGPHRDLPLAVLIDNETASASEIVAAALQDAGRAVVIGERSFGKGTVQHLLPLEAGRSRLKLTVASYWRPSGVNIHRLPSTPESAAWGVSPDAGREVALSEEERLAWLRWRRQRDLLAVEGADPPEAPPAAPLEADTALSVGVESLSDGA